jgi:hypothetical protein
VGLSAFGRARLAKSAGRTQKNPRLRVKLAFLLPSASLGLPAASVPEASAPAASASVAAAFHLATGGFVDAEADPRSSPSRLFVPTRAMGERKRPTARHRIGTCSFAFTFEGDKIPVLI